VDEVADDEVVGDEVADHEMNELVLYLHEP
jgi:hypothetical protein